MSYNIKWNDKPLKYLEKLPKDISLRVLKKLDEVVKEQVNVTGISAINLTAEGNYTWRVTTVGATTTNSSKIRSSRQRKTK